MLLFKHCMMMFGLLSKTECDKCLQRVRYPASVWLGVKTVGNHQ
jgi:hypothetical protein